VGASAVGSATPASPSGLSDEASAETPPSAQQHGMGGPTAAQMPLAALLGPDAVRPTLGSAPDLGPPPDPFRPAQVVVKATATPVAPAYVAAPVAAGPTATDTGSES